MRVCPGIFPVFVFGTASWLAMKNGFRLSGRLERMRRSAARRQKQTTARLSAKCSRRFRHIRICTLGRTPCENRRVLPRTRRAHHFRRERKTRRGLWRKYAFLTVENRSENISSPVRPSVVLVVTGGVYRSDSKVPTTKSDEV